MGSPLATVFVAGNVFFNLLKPYAMATSSMMSHSWSMSGRVGGTCTTILSETVLLGPGSAALPILCRYLMISPCDRLRPVQLLM